MSLGELGFQDLEQDILRDQICRGDANDDSKQVRYEMRSPLVQPWGR